MSTNEQGKNYVLNLAVKPEGDPVATFNDLKELQKLGYAHNGSSIIYKGVCVPAGYCVDYRNFIVTHSAIVSGDQALIYEQVPTDLERDDIVQFLLVCARSLKKQGRVPLTKEDVMTFIEYRESQKKEGQK